MDLTRIPHVDNHVHALTRAQPGTVEEFRANFTEAHSPELARAHVQTAVHYRWALKQIASALECEPTEDAILERRRSLPFAEYGRTLVTRANIACLLLDEGYPPPSEAYDIAEMGTMLGVATRRILRLETLVADLVLSHDRFEDVVGAFDREVSDARPRGYVALKSIAAYRTGLAIEPVRDSDAEDEFGSVRAEAVERGSLRLASKPLVDFFVWRGLEHAARQKLPVQFHTGYGDPDLDLRLANPLHLRPLFEEARFEAAPIVLLHESYPFTGAAAYLAASYPNAYMDLAFSLPPLDLLELRRVVETALGAVPAGKLLVSSDGTRIPEHYYLGAVRARLVLSSVLESMVLAGELAEEEAMEIAAMLLHGNAGQLYGLGCG